MSDDTRYTTESGRYQLAFNMGSQARIDGLSLLCCPPGRANCLEQRAWKDGHTHVSLNWGRYARWFVRPLPMV